MSVGRVDFILYESRNLCYWKVRGKSIMKLFGIGNALLHYRLKYGLLQEDVCDGICSAATLSRIETGRREFDSLITEVLIGRLGKTVYKYEFLQDNYDYYYYSRRSEIEICVEHMELDQAEKLIFHYMDHLPENNHSLHRQFLLYHQFLIAKKRAGLGRKFALIFKRQLV